jgi:sugar transferase (PEP-CTERM/EpsH1 system associated)
LDMKAKKIRSLPLLLTSKPLTLGVYGSRELQEIVDRLMPDIDLVIAYSSSMGAFVLPHSDTKRIQYIIELDSDKWAQYEAFTRPPMKWVYGREARTLRKFEKELCTPMDMNVLCTPLEQRIFEEAVPGAPSCVMRNGVDLELFNPDSNAPEPGHIVFTGVMDYFPNTDGCVWFAKEILPAVQLQIPGARFSIVGSSPTDEIKALGNLPGVEVTGFVDETRDWLARADLAVAPLRIARGIQNKVLEAMSMGLPIVGTTNATQGVDAQNGRDYIVADTVEGQVEAIVKLLQDRQEAQALGARARAFVEKNYRWDDVLAPLGKLIASFE